jgi:hypothetical protein
VAVSTAAAALLVYGKGQDAATDLFVIALAGHVALGFRQFSAANQGVTAEALPTVLSTSHVESLRIAVGNAFGCGDLVNANVGESDAAKNPFTASRII